jgi:hypothetical protein
LSKALGLKVGVPVTPAEIERNVRRHTKSMAEPEYDVDLKIGNAKRLIQRAKEQIEYLIENNRKPEAQAVRRDKLKPAQAKLRELVAARKLGDRMLRGGRGTAVIPGVNGGPTTYVRKLSTEPEVFEEYPDPDHDPEQE